MELIDDYKKEYKKAENEINMVYQKILKQYKTDILFIKKLKAAQRLWIQFRDAELAARFPLDKSEYGSIYPVCHFQMLTQLTKDRIKTLNIWLEGEPEGDVCSGSVRIK